MVWKIFLVLPGFERGAWDDRKYCLAQRVSSLINSLNHDNLISLTRKQTHICQYERNALYIATGSCTVQCTKQAVLFPRIVCAFCVYFKLCEILIFMIHMQFKKACVFLYYIRYHACNILTFVTFAHYNHPFDNI